MEFPVFPVGSGPLGGLGVGLGTRICKAKSLVTEFDNSFIWTVQLLLGPRLLLLRAVTFDELASL